MAADFQHFSWQRDNSLKEDESNDIQQLQPSYSTDSPFEACSHFLNKYKILEKRIRAIARKFVIKT
jgi:hypothetical protein